MKKFLLFSVFIVLIVICGLVAYTIFNLVTKSEPKDLGVVSTQEDYDKFITKTNSKVQNYNEAPVLLQEESGTILFTKPKEYELGFSNSEISGRINYSTWSTMPASNVQVKFSDDNKIQVSGNLVSANLLEFASMMGYSEDAVNQGLDYLSKMGDNPSFYIDATASVTDNQLSLDVSKVKINNFSIPAGAANDALTSATESIMSQVDGLDAKSVNISENALNFEGTAPSVIYLR